MPKPLRVALAATSFMLAAASSARADASYLLGLQGVDQRHYPVCRLPDQAPPCDTTVDLPWSGKLEITVDSGADGVYSDSDVLAFDFRTSAGSLVLPFMPGSVTVDGGHVTSVDMFTFPADDGFYTFSGLRASYSRDFDAGHLVTDSASGVLASIPEPGAATLIIFALACAWAGSARSRRWRAPWADA
jgi:hypothetical protein